MSQRRATVHRARAAAELPAMLTVPMPTPAELLPALEERERFGIPAEIIRPEDRVLTPHHAAAILCTASTPSMPLLQAVSKVVGGKWLVPFEELQRQAQQRDEDEAIRRLQVDAQRRAASQSEQQQGPSLAVITL